VTINLLIINYSVTRYIFHDGDFCLVTRTSTVLAPTI